MEPIQQPFIIQALPASNWRSMETPLDPQLLQIDRMEPIQSDYVIQALPASSWKDTETPAKQDTGNLQSPAIPCCTRDDPETAAKQDTSSLQSPSISHCTHKDTEAAAKQDTSSLHSPAISHRTRKDSKSPAKQDTSSRSPAISRCTRSQAAPDWTVQETLILISEIAVADEDCLKAFSSYQKWKIISDNCTALDVIRSSNQCKRRWESLLADYKKIRDWESLTGAGSYWCLEVERRKEFGLPVMFDQEVFGSIDAVLKAQEARLGSGGSDSEELITTAEAEMVDVDDDDSGSEKFMQSKTQKSTQKAQEMASKMQQNAQQIHAILRGELTDNASSSRGPVDLTKPNAIETEFTRRQADELIKALGGLVGTLNQFNELIKDGECEGIRPMNSMSL